MINQKVKYDLSERLIKFGVLIIQIVEVLPNDRVGNHMGGQLLRSGTSAALNYGEAISAESRKDFIHKIKIVLKELRETLMCLRILIGASKINSENKLGKECDELIAIFYKSVLTAKRNSN